MFSAALYQNAFWTGSARLKRCHTIAAKNSNASTAPNMTSESGINLTSSANPSFTALVSQNDPACPLQPQGCSSTYILHNIWSVDNSMRLCQVTSAGTGTTRRGRGAPDWTALASTVFTHTAIIIVPVVSRGSSKSGQRKGKRNCGLEQLLIPTCTPHSDSNSVQRYNSENQRTWIASRSDCWDFSHSVGLLSTTGRDSGVFHSPPEHHFRMHRSSS